MVAAPVVARGAAGAKTISRVIVRSAVLYLTPITSSTAGEDRAAKPCTVAGTPCNDRRGSDGFSVMCSKRSIPGSASPLAAFFPAVHPWANKRLRLSSILHLAGGIMLADTA